MGGMEVLMPILQEILACLEPQVKENHQDYGREEESQHGDSYMLE